MSTVETIEQTVGVVEVSDTETVVSEETKILTVEIAIDGPQGPPGADGADGAQGPQGPTGPAGGSFVHEQSVPASTWTITHNLGFFPNVVVLDTLGRTVWGQVSYTNSNTMVIVFTASFSGTAYLS